MTDTIELLFDHSKIKEGMTLAVREQDADLWPGDWHIVAVAKAEHTHYESEDIDGPDALVLFDLDGHRVIGSVDEIGESLVRAVVLEKGD